MKCLSACVVCSFKNISNKDLVVSKEDHRPKYLCCCIFISFFKAVILTSSSKAVAGLEEPGFMMFIF